MAGYFGSNYFGSNYWASGHFQLTTTPVPPVPVNPVIIASGGSTGRRAAWPWYPVWPNRRAWPKWLQDVIDERERQREARQALTLAQVHADDEEILRLL